LLLVVVAKNVARFADGHAISRLWGGWGRPHRISLHKADKAALIITNRKLKTMNSLRRSRTCASTTQSTPRAYSLRDVLFGAIVTDWNEDVTAEPKRRVMAQLLSITDEYGPR
jgi:hypothetical protein